MPLPPFASTALLRSFRDLGFLGYTPLVSLPGPALNLSLPQPPHFGFFGFTMARAQLCSVIFYPHALQKFIYLSPLREERRGKTPYTYRYV